MPCNWNHRKLAEKVMQGVRAAGGTPIEVNTISITDGITMIQARDLSGEDFGGAHLEGCNENLNLTRPDVIREIHEAYLDAGADCISTNTFGCAPYVLAEYGLSDRCHDIVLAAARLAKTAADSRSTADRPRFVLGAMGVLSRSVLEHGGHVTGVIPRALLDLGVGETKVSELVVTDGLRDRKAIMAKTLLTSVESLVTAESVGELTLKGFAEPVPAYNVLSLREG